MLWGMEWWKYPILIMGVFLFLLILKELVSIFRVADFEIQEVDESSEEDKKEKT